MHFPMALLRPRPRKRARARARGRMGEEDADDAIVHALMHGGSFDAVRRAIAHDDAFVARVVDARALLHHVPQAVQRELIAAGADVNVIDVHTGWTLLNAAVCERNVGWVRELLDCPGIDLDRVSFAGGNGPLANAVYLHAYDIADVLLAAGARCAPVVYVGARRRLLVQDMAMPEGLFTRLLPLADLPARRDAYLSAFSAMLHHEGTLRKVVILGQRYGMPAEFVAIALRMLLTSPLPAVQSELPEALVRAFLDQGGDPCAMSRQGCSLFASVQRCAAMLGTQADILQMTYDVAVEDATVLAQVKLLDVTRERVLVCVAMLERVWGVMAPYANPLPVHHADAVIRYTGMTAEAYVELAIHGSPRAWHAAHGRACRMLRRWYVCAPDERLAEARVRFWGMVCAFAVLRSPAVLMRHRLRVVAAGARRMRAIRQGLILEEGAEVIDHVTHMPVEVDDAGRVRMFSGAKVWDAGQHPPPRFCVDVVHFAQHVAMRRRPLSGRAEEESLTLNGIVYDASVVGALGRAYVDYKARVDPSKEAWVELPAAARWASLRASTFEARYGAHHGGSHGGSHGVS